MNNIQNSSRLVVLILILMISITGCKSKKKAMEASNAAKEKARIEQEATLRKQQENEAKRKEAEENEKRKAEAALKASETKILEPRIRLNDYFETIAKSGNTTSANSSINEALTLFASPETPVLIIISEEGGLKDYDRPTTIKEYLHYLKDQKKNSNILSGIKVDSAGKITEVELKKPL